jgi:carboxyl-terminal processing protease
MKSTQIKKNIFFVAVVQLLYLSCVVDYDDPSHYDDIFDKEFEYCITFLNANFFYKSSLPENPQTYKTPDSLYKSLNDTPYTEYLDSSDAYEYEASIKAESDASLGIDIEAHSRGAVITYIYINSPADGANLQRGDTIVKINDSSLANLSLENMNEYLEEQTGEEKELEVVKKDSTNTNIIKIQISEYSFPSVCVDIIDSSLAYIYITAFLNDSVNPKSSSTEFDRAMQIIHADSTDSINTIILDLRENFIGEFDQCIQIAEKFVEKDIGLIRVWESDTSQANILKSNGPGTYKNKILYLLINDSTAGAAEILASALTTEESGLISFTYGDTTSFGYGSMQVTGNTPNGNYAKVTCAQVITMSGDTLKNNGIKPDSDKEYFKGEDVLKTVLDDLNVADSDKHVSRINTIRLEHKTKKYKPICLKKSF